MQPDAANDAIAAIQTHDTLRGRCLLSPSVLHQVLIPRWSPSYKTMIERNTFLLCYPKAIAAGVDVDLWKELLKLLATPGLPAQREKARYVIIRHMFPENIANHIIRLLTNPRFLKDRYIDNRILEDKTDLRKRLTGYLMSYYEYPNLCHQVELILAASSIAYREYLDG